MDVTLQRQDLVEIADRAANFRDSMLRLRTDENRLIVSATGRTAPDDPISKVVPDTLLPAVVFTPGTANGDPAELSRQARALEAVRTRLIAISVWPGFELTGLDTTGMEWPAPVAVAVPDEPVAAEPEASAPPPPPTPSPRPATFDMSPHVAALLAAGVIKTRKPWTVPVFGVLTLGIYLFVWYYRVNRELRDLGAVSGEPGRALDVKPGRSTLAVSLGALLIVPLIVSINRTLHRIQTAERLTNAPEPELSVGKGWGLFVLLIPFWTAYAQSHLNRVWLEQLRRSLVERPASGLEASHEADRDDLDLDSDPSNQGSELWPVSPEPAPPPPVLAPAPPPTPLPVPVLLPPLIEDAPPPHPPPEPVVMPEPLAMPEPAAMPAPPPEPLPERVPVSETEPEPEPAPVPPPPVAVPPPVVAEAPVPKPDIHDPAIETIRGRYARGEISRQEYRDLLEDLA